MTHRLDRPTFEEVLRTLYRGTYANRDSIRETLNRFNTTDTLQEPLTEDEVAEYVNRIRLYQEEYRQRSEAHCIGVGLIFPLPQPDQLLPAGQEWLAKDMELK